MRRLLKHAVKIISATVIVLTFLAYLAPLVNPGIFRWLAFFGTAFPWLLIANLVLLSVWAFRVHRFALYHLGILLFGWQYITAFIGLNVGKDVVPDEAITVATHNIGGLFQGINLEEEIWDNIFNEYTRFLKENGNPDILCTQETARKFYPRLAEMMGYKYNFNLKKGTVILSRYPMEGGGEVPFGKTTNSSLWVDIRIRGRLLRVYNLHLQSNRVTGTTTRVIDEAELDKEETWKEINKVLRKVGGATSIRAEQAKRLREHMAACPHPVIVCGDFNDTPNSYVYSLISEGLDDTFREKGLGLGTTFAGRLPFLRIDYVLTDPKIKIYSCHIPRNDISDHYPVFAQIGW